MQALLLHAAIREALIITTITMKRRRRRRRRKKEEKQQEERMGVEVAAVVAHHLHLLFHLGCSPSAPVSIIIRHSSNNTLIDLPKEEVAPQLLNEASTKLLILY